jgi:hypothetical protein
MKIGGDTGLVRVGRVGPLFVADGVCPDKWDSKTGSHLSQKTPGSCRVTGSA